MGPNGNFLRRTVETFLSLRAAVLEISVLSSAGQGNLIIVHIAVDYHPCARFASTAATVGKNWVRGFVLYTGTEVIPFSANLHGVPMSRLWSA
jgi:hypothetical protein